MKIKNILTTSLLMLGFLSASAQSELPAASQEQVDEQPQTRTEYVFQPHWYVQLQPVGLEYTRGELDFSDMLTYNVQAAIGYQFNKYFGARLAVNAWQDKNGVRMKQIGFKETYQWKHIAPTLDLTANLSNLFFGYNPTRFFNLGLFAGIGANYAWSNDDAKALKTRLDAYPHVRGFDSFALLWDDNKLNLMGQAGLTGDFRINDKISFGLEVNANLLPDNYNSKKAGNADWYFSALAGVKINLGTTYTTRDVDITGPTRIVYRDRWKEKIVTKDSIIYVPKPDDTNIRRDIFFTIRATKIVAEEMPKVFEIAIFLNQHPNAKVKVTGYADKGTGNATINERLGRQRAQAVRDALVRICDIDPSRIIMDSKGDTVQPFAENDKNRVSICIAE